jgi:hypothetical protein
MGSPPAWELGESLTACYEVLHRTGGWGTLHNEELRNLYASPNIVKVIKSMRKRWAGACSTHGRDDKCIQIVYRET